MKNQEIKNQNILPSPYDMIEQFEELGFEEQYSDGDCVALSSENENIESLVYVNYVNDGEDKSQYSISYSLSVPFAKYKAINEKAFKVYDEVLKSYSDEKEGMIAARKAMNEIMSEIEKRVLCSSVEDLMIALAEIAK